MAQTSTTSHLYYHDGKVSLSANSKASDEALRRRVRHQRKVVEMGLTPDVIGQIVDEFYHRVRAHAILGPVFDARVEDRWELHLEKMKSFWLSVALNAGTYSGKPNEAHKSITGVNTNHFYIWLGLFRQTVRDVTGSEEATAYLDERAERMSNSIKRAMGLPT